MSGQWVPIAELIGKEGKPGDAAAMGRFDRIENGVELTAGANANLLTENGDYYSRYGDVSATLVNFPEKASGHLRVRTTRNGVTTQMWQTIGQSFQVWARSTASVSAGTWSEWLPLVNRIDGVQDNTRSAFSRDIKVQRYEMRRGGVIGTGGLPAIALRYDHGLANFKAKILPLLRKYNLPSGQMINPAGLAEPGNASSFTELQSWALNDGVEMAFHGRTHGEADNSISLRREILTGLEEMKAGLPKLEIEMWAPPGVGGSAFMGFDTGKTPESFYDTEAGQLIMANHAVGDGHSFGSYRSLDGKVYFGGGRPTIDEQTPSWVASIIRGAMNEGMGLELMLHPVYLDQPGYMTTSQLDEVLANIAALRDQGKLTVLTPSGLYVADSKTEVRHNLLRNSTFRDGLTGWAATGAYDVVTERGITFARTTSGTSLVQNAGFGRQKQFVGGPRELVCKVRTNGTAVVRTRATAAGVGLNATRDHTITAAQGWIEVRQPLIIPATIDEESLITTTGRVSGSRVDITDIRLQAI